MRIAVKNKRTGKVYDNGMETGTGIIEIHFSTSYTQVVVQDEIEDGNGGIKYPRHDIIIDIDGAYWVDLIATQGDDRGEWVKENAPSDSKPKGA